MTEAIVLGHKIIAERIEFAKAMIDLIAGFVPLLFNDILFNTNES